MQGLARGLGVHLIGVMLFAGCATSNANLNNPMKLSIEGKRVAVFPFMDPHYGGRQLSGVGTPFAVIFVTKLQSEGITSKLITSGDFKSSGPIDVEKACKYASENSFDLVITGTVTEWIDGATQWSGTVDVAALYVNVYQAKECKFEGFASEREVGRWLTFTNEPTTRFYGPLSEAIIYKMLNK